MATGGHKFKEITVVPSAKDLVDIALSQTQRKTPTVVHPQYAIARIRRFYMRKVKFCQQTFHERLSQIITQFPRLEDIHPFYGDLCHVLYDKDHYKLALGQTNACRGVVDAIAKDYVRLLKYADSPYKCKMLKRAALGRMCTATRKLQPSLVYLEEVRQHLARLPSINPTTRSLIVTGYPNVGKSSFMNKVTRANVEVQPYAFTTKSLFVGHFDWGYARWQVIDTPGILDQPLAERNTIELTAITALAHIHAAILYFLDLSEMCGFSLEQQVALFHSIKALFRNRPLLVVLNKIDLRKLEDLSEEEKAMIKGMADGIEKVEFHEMSCLAEVGIDEAKNRACELLMSQRVTKKVESRRVDVNSAKLHITEVTPRPDRPPCIPESVIIARQKKAMEIEKEEESENEDIDGDVELDDDNEKNKTSLQLMEEGGGAGVYSHDIFKNWMLSNPEWRYDKAPEIFDGQNVADFVDPAIEQRLQELEAEEMRELDALEPEDEVEAAEWREAKQQLAQIHSLREFKMLESRLKKTRRRSGVTPRKSVNVSDVRKHLETVGYETEAVKARAEAPRRGRELTRGRSLPSDSDDSDGDADMRGRKRRRDSSDESMGDSEDKTRMRLAKKARKRVRSFSVARSRSTVRAQSGVRDLSLPPSRVDKGVKETDKKKAEKIKRLKERMRNMRGFIGEADRFIGTKMPKHLFSGKRGIGKTDRR